VRNCFLEEILSNKRGADGGLSVSIADEIERRLDGIEGSVLPSSRQLSTELDVSRPVVLAALKILGRRGVVELRGNRPARIIGRRANKSEPTSRRCSVEKTYKEMVELIRSGGFRAGDALPKWSNLTRTFHVSSSTISIVLKKLRRQNYVHANGKRDIVGPAPRRDAPVSSRQTILVLTPRAHDWTYICKDQDTERFGREFVDQAEYSGVSLFGIALHGTPPAGASVAHPDAAENLIRKLGGQYRGTLVPVTRKKLPDIERWLDFFSRFGRPVVWFDRNNAGFDMPDNSKKVTRVYISQRDAMAEVIRFLENKGFHGGCFPFIPPMSDWQKSRYSLLCEIGDHRSPPFTIELLAPDDMPQWLCPVREGVPKRLEELRARLGGRVTALLNHFDKRLSELRERYGSDAFTPEIRHSPEAGFLGYLRAVQGLGKERIDRLEGPVVTISTLLQLLPLIRNPRLALIAPRDSYAEHLMRVLAPIGQGVFDSFPIISFDNRIRYSFQSLTSLDFGFAELAYQSLHMILRDLPTRRPTSGALASIPYVVDRGSVRQIGA